MALLLHLLALFLIAGTLLPWLREGDWWIRIFDFPRLQLAATGTLVLVAYVWLIDQPTAVGVAIQLALAAAMLYQLWRIRPYTPLAARQVEPATVDEAGRCALRLMIANVYTPNRRAEQFIALVRRFRPDVLLAVETDTWWEEQLRPLEDELPHTLKHPLPNTYGMLLYSRYPLVRPQVRFLVESDVPSMFSTVDLPCCPNLQLYCLHPRPPRPSKRQDSTNRDAELVLVGHQIRHPADPVIVAGDLNDVAWSYTTTLFQRISGLLDPRRGRGMYNTFHAGIPLLRYPLDHVFHSAHFRLVRLQRLPGFGSDHFPILVELSYERHAAAQQNTPDADSDELKLSREMIARARREEESRHD